MNSRPTHNFSDQRPTPPEDAAFVAAVRESLADPAQREKQSASARHNFDAVHERLMLAIETSYEQPAQDPKPSLVGRFPTLSSRMLRLAAPWKNLPIAAALLGVAWLGHAIGVRHEAARHERYQLPAQTLVADFDSSLHQGPGLEFVSDRNEPVQQAKQRLKQVLGLRPHLPIKPQKDARLLGARRHVLSHHQGARAHYLKQGMQLAVYQFHGPRWGLRDWKEVQWKGRTFMAQEQGAYRVVAWRTGDDVMAMVSPLALVEPETMQLASDLRTKEND